MKKTKSRRVTSTKLTSAPLRSAIEAKGPLYIEVFSGGKTLEELATDIHEVEAHGYVFRHAQAPESAEGSNVIVFEQLPRPQKRKKLNLHCTTAPKSAEVIHSADLIVEGDPQTVCFWRTLKESP